MKKRHVRLCVLFFIAMISTVCAQQRRLDSILALSNAYHKEDSLKAVYYRETFRAYNSVRNTAKAEQYIDSAVQAASRLPNKMILTTTYWRAGSVFHNSNKLKAITYYKKAIETAHNNNLGPKAESAPWINLGVLYMDVPDYPKSLDAYEHALQLVEGAGDEDTRSNCYMNIASIYLALEQYVKCMEYARKANRAFEKAKDNRGIAVVCDAMVTVYFHAADNELQEMGIAPSRRNAEILAALDKGLKCILHAEEDDPSMVSAFYRNYGKMYERIGNYTLALQNYTKAAELLSNGDQEYYGDNLLALGDFYVNRLNNYEKGIGILHTALADSRSHFTIGVEEDLLLSLSRAHEKVGRYDSSLFYFKEAIVVKDSIMSREKEQEITRRQLKLDFDVKERDYKIAQQLSDARLKQQEQQILLRNQQLQISDKEKTLQRLTFLQKQVELENQKQLQQNQLVQAQQKAAFDKQSRDQQIKVQNVQLELNRRVSLFLGILAVIVFAVAMFIFNARRKTERLNKIVSDQKEELEELVAVKDRIFSIVSHDMRTPVNNIIAFSSLLEDGDIEQERLALYLEQIKGTLDHTSSLMENMLNWAASQMQGFTPVMEAVDAAAVAQHIVAGVAPSLYKKKIECVNLIESPVWVHGDRNMVELILRNLVNNAIKFTNTHGKIELSVARQHGIVRLGVKDTGVGMSEEKVNQVNSHTTQSMQSTPGTNKEKGTGLGLVLCKHFAHIMRGAIHAESAAGTGSTFVLSLHAAVNQLHESP